MSPAQAARLSRAEDRWLERSRERIRTAHRVAPADPRASTPDDEPRAAAARRTR